VIFLKIHLVLVGLEESLLMMNASQLKLEWMQGKPVHDWIPQWRLIKSENR